MLNFKNKTMKKLLLLTKTLLAAALLCAGATNAWATDVPYAIGSEGCGYRAEYSDPYTVKNGETLHITFTNNNFGTSTIWYNYMLEATSAVDKHDGVYFDLRADNYAFDAGTFVQNYNGNCLSDLNGATVDNYITYVGGVITVNQIFTKAEVTTYNRVYTYTVDGAPSSVIIYVTEEAAQVTITNVETSKWSTVWSTDFSSAPTGMTYSTSGSNASVGIGEGYLLYKLTNASGGRSMTTTFTDTKFNVDTDWILDFDWSCVYNNSNSNVVFATNSENVFKIEWNGSNATITDYAAEPNTLTSSLPHQGTYSSKNQIVANMTSPSHFTVKGVKDDGVYLTVTKAGTTYVNNVKVSSTFSYPKSFNGTLSRYYSSMALDNIIFQTPAVAGFVATPTSEITGAVGTSRKFTLSCLTDGVTIYYATSDLEKGAAGWEEYTGEVTTDATTIYAYAKDDEENTSDKMNFATGAGTTLKLNTPVLTKTAYADGNYTISISSDQSSLAVVPASPSVKYSIDGGDAQTYSAPLSVAGGKTITSWVENTGYTTSDNANITTAARPTYYATEWTQDYRNVTSAAGTGVQSISLSDESFTINEVVFKNIVSYGDPAVEVNLNTNVGLNTTSGVGLRCNGANSGIIVNNANDAKIGIQNLKVGDYIVLYVTGIVPTASYGCTLQEGMSTWSEYYFRATETSASINIPKGTYNYIYTITVLSSSVSATIGSNGFTTFASPYALDLTAATQTANSFKAYRASAVNDETVTFKDDVDQNVVANTGVLLKGTANAVVTIPVVASGSALADNALQVNAAGTTFDAAANTTYYGMNKGSNPLTFGTFNPSSVAIPASKAYLALTSIAAREVRVVFGDITGVANVEAAAEAKAKEGKFIENGKLVIVKNGQKFNAAGAQVK